MISQALAGAGLDASGEFLVVAENRTRGGTVYAPDALAPVLGCDLLRAGDARRLGSQGVEIFLEVECAVIQDILHCTVGIREPKEAVAHEFP